MTFIIPYRDRQRHLSVFIPHYKSLFPEAKFIIIEQEKCGDFNRGKLLNIGFLESITDYCVFHDVDMIAQNPNYDFPVMPTHTATNVEQFGYQMPFPQYIGGVLLMNHNDFIRCNGFSNEFKGWGGEDNEMYDNIIKSGLSIHHRQTTYKSLPHTRPFARVNEKNLAQAMKGRGQHDGLTHCKYSVTRRIETQPNVSFVTVCV